MVHTMAMLAATASSFRNRMMLAAAAASSPVVGSSRNQGLTLVHCSAQLEPCPTPKNTLHTSNTPQHPLNTGYTNPTGTPYPMNIAQVELRSERV